MNRDVLERPFEPQIIKSRKGHSGKSFVYVEGAEYIRRLNEAFEGKWSFEVVHHSINGRDIVVIGRLEAEGCVKNAFGGSTITTNHHTGEPISLADDLKAAATDALKKAASLFGIGLHLHGSDHSVPDEGVVHLYNAPRGTSEIGHSSGRAGGPTTGKGAPKTTKKTLTERQLNAILAIARTLGLTSEELRQRSIESYGVPFNELSKTNASAFISDLQGENKSAA